jgi:phosphoribosylglycinamide formyltransferase-1
MSEVRELRMAILASGSGSNAEAILKQCREGALPARPMVLVSNNPDAFALTRAKQYDLPALVANHRDHRRRSAHEQRIIELLQPFDVELIVLAGYMRIVTATLIDAFHGRRSPGLPGVINIHPADTAQYQGAHGYEYAMGLLPESPERLEETKITVHFVDTGVDTGPVIAQRPVPIKDDDDIDALRKRGLAVEHELYPTCLRLYAEGRLSLAGGRVVVDGTSTAGKK